jgi:hypothetical protein
LNLSRKPGRQTDLHGYDFSMAEYRAYLVGHDGHFVSFEGFASLDDGEAITKAKRLVDGHDVELWSGERFIIRLDHKKAAPE